MWDFHFLKNYCLKNYCYCWYMAAPWCHSRGPRPIKDEISHQNYIHAWHWITRFWISKLVIYFLSKSHYKCIGFMFFGWFFADLSVQKFSPVDEYTMQHHTFKFQQSEDVNDPRRIFIRRGNAINFNMTLTRPINKNKMTKQLSFNLVFSLGKRPRESNDTLVVVKCRHIDGNEGFKRKQSANEWAGRIVRADGKDVLFEVFIPSSAIVGAYSMEIEYFDTLIHELKDEVVILFNPWNEGELVLYTFPF